MRNTKKLPWILILICLSCFATSAFASEADIHIPDLKSVKFAGLGGMTGTTLMMLGIVVCAIGALFGIVQYLQTKGLPVHESTERIGVALDTVAARAGVECGPLLWSRLRARLGAGVDIVRVKPESSDPAATLTGARWTASVVASAALRANLARRPGLFWLSAALFADVLPTTVRYDAIIDGATAPVFSPWRVRPGLTVELTFF